MATPHYPDHVPGDTKLRRLLKTTRRVITYSDSPFFAVFSDGVTVCRLPPRYLDHLRRFVWREAAIRLVLQHRKTLDLPELLEENIKMVLWYMDIIFERLVTEANKERNMETAFRSDVFENYLIIEFWVRRHEPKAITKFRATNDRNLDRTSLEDCDWAVYEYALGGIWTGARVQYTFTDTQKNPKTVATLAETMKTFYQPPIGVDDDYGYTFREHLEERVKVVGSDEESEESIEEDEESG